MELLFKGHRISDWDDENVLEIVATVPQLVNYISPTELYT